MDDPSLPLVAAEVVRYYLAVVDDEAPGLVEGLYLTGSIALDDFHPGVSDIDFVAVTRDPVSRPEALRRAHERVRDQYRKPFLDGIYVTWDDLAADPRLAAPGPVVHSGVVRGSATGARHPVTWQELASYGIPVRGPHQEDIEIWSDQDALLSYTRANLTSYWRPWLLRRRSLLSVPGLTSLTPAAATWAVLGVSRLHQTLATRRLTSKQSAGRYALTRFERRWHEIIEEGLRIRLHPRARSTYANPLRRRRETLGYVDMVLTDAQRLTHVT